MTEPISSEEPPLNRIALLQRIIEQLLMNWLYQLCWLSHVKYTSNPHRCNPITVFGNVYEILIRKT